MPYESSNFDHDEDASIPTRRGGKYDYMTLGVHEGGEFTSVGLTCQAQVCLPPDLRQQANLSYFA
jgi:hypothetical protein